MRDPARATGGRWPELDWHAWKDTATTSHMWMQIVGKTRFVLTPLQNHWGMFRCTSVRAGWLLRRCRGGVVCRRWSFDFLAHVLRLRMSSGAMVELALKA